MGEVLGIVYRCIATHLIREAGFSRKTARTGVVTLIQRFGSALNLNIDFPMLFLDGLYVERGDGALRFRWVKALTARSSSGWPRALRSASSVSSNGILHPREVCDTATPPSAPGINSRIERTRAATSRGQR